MSKAYICDRCGATIEYRAVKTIRHAIWKHSVFSKSNSSEYWCYHDLCISCGEKLKKFLDGCELKGLEG